ncbi:MAG TPA: helix-turn-helix domain-containing protein [Candidatus Scybalocola faecavium]|nr:helix-turn-helix domain-containing protein [Candidatus Scybalocola faecavium]
MDLNMHHMKIDDVFQLTMVNRYLRYAGVTYDAKFLFVLGGTVELKENDEKYILRESDFAYIKPGDKFHVAMYGEDALFLEIRINLGKICRIMGKDSIFIACNSTMEGGQAYGRLESILNRLISQLQYGAGANYLTLLSILYRFLYVLIRNFEYEPEYQDLKKSQDEKRLNRIIQYVNTNYNGEISLHGLSEYLHLTQEYVSKYIKKQLGCSFLQYLNDLRLENAEEELINTNKTILDIALDNGFAGSAALGKAIKKKYDMTPVQFRQKNRVLSQEDDVQFKEQQHMLEEKVKQYVLNHPQDKSESNWEEVLLNIDSRRQNTYGLQWKDVLNVGRAKDLLLTEIQEQILLFKNQIGIKYARFWDIWAPELFMVQEREENGKKYNFSKLDYIIDFLVSNGIHPFIELGFKPDIILSNTDNYIIDTKRDNFFSGEEDHREFVVDFLHHYYALYGEEEMSRWIIEEWYDPSMSPEQYFSYFDTTKNAFRELSGATMVGGGGFALMQKGHSLQELLQMWRNYGTVPDFISIYCYPVMPVHKDDVKAFFPLYDPDYILHQIKKTREYMELSGMGSVKLFVTEWNFTVSNRNLLNDTVFKGAYIIKNMLDCLDQVEYAAYWPGSDLIGDYKDSRRIMNGGGGLLSRDSIRKPAFWAMSFLKNLKRVMLEKTENTIVTTDGHGHFTILCHNCKHPNYYYYQLREDELSVKNVSQYFSDSFNLRIRYHIEGVQNGKWIIRFHKVNEDHGNALKCWQDLEEMMSLTKEDIEYIKAASQPEMQIRTVMVENELLEFEADLEPQEFQYIHIIHQM